MMIKFLIVFTFCREGEEEEIQFDSTGFISAMQQMFGQFFYCNNMS